MHAYSVTTQGNITERSHLYDSSLVSVTGSLRIQVSLPSIYFLKSAHVCEALVKRGHEVTFIISSVSSYQVSDSRWGPLFNFIVYDNPYPDNAFRKTTDVLVKASFQDGITSGMLQSAELVYSSMVPDCQQVLSDLDILMNKVIAKQFDMMGYDYACSAYLTIHYSPYYEDRPRQATIQEDIPRR
ncbi:hypothetical protein BSL78_15580 [Apostichopus japonicus]|uniref:Uncharacterized protein n=1 Tax=Stichopus japonicus TaxID=307972 RepID=A0A2G8KHU2_STIJA|nr:hypothetical protein BSL78_28173 [Apostichopus japonicus]PIK47562.1 hypothetical protein BSL78_15580 [Apostichopus japonicus]